MHKYGWPKGAVRVAREATYPWPCQSNPRRTIIIFDDDVLTKRDDGKGYDCHTGIMKLMVQIPDSDVIPWEQEGNLVIGSFDEAFGPNEKGPSND